MEVVLHFHIVFPAAPLAPFRCPLTHSVSPPVSSYPLIFRSRAYMKRTPGRGGSDGASQGFSSTAAASAGAGGGSAVGVFNCRDRLRGMGRPQLVLLLVVGTAVIAAHLVVFTAIIRRSLHHCGPAADSPAGWAVGDARDAAGAGDSSSSSLSSSGVSVSAGSANTAGEGRIGGDGGDGAVREGGKVPPQFIMYRIIGNNMPPLQCPSQLLWNTQYALRHEGELEGCEKRWVINQIVNRTERALLIDSLLAHGYSLNHILIRRLNLSKISEYPREQWLDVVTAQNEARNAAIEDGVRAGARWILPLDGNHFITQEAWAAIRRSAEQAESKGYKYFKVPVHRLHAEQKPAWLHGNSTFATIRRYIPQMIESQLAFRYDAPERFKAGMVYGMQNKLELLQRACGVPGEAGYQEQCGCADLGKEGQLHPSDPKIAAACGYSLRLWFFPCNGTEPDKVFNNGLYRKRLRTKSRQTMHAVIKNLMRHPNVFYVRETETLDTEMDDAKAGGSTAEEAKGGEVKVEESKPKETGLGDAKTGETGAGEDKAGENRMDEGNRGETGTEVGAVRSKEAVEEETGMQDSKKGETGTEEADARPIRTEEAEAGETRTEEVGAGVTRVEDAITGEAGMEVDEAKEAEGGLPTTGKTEARETIMQEFKEGETKTEEADAGVIATTEVKTGSNLAGATAGETKMAEVEAKETATEKVEGGETAVNGLEAGKPEETKAEEVEVEEIHMDEAEANEAVEEDSPWDLLEIPADCLPGGNAENNGSAAAGAGAAAEGRSTASPASGASRAMGADLLREACADLLADSPQRSLTLRELLPALKSLNRADLAPALAEVIGAAEGRSRGSAHEGRLRSVLTADSRFTIQGMGKSVSVALAAAESDREEGEGAGKRKMKAGREGKRGGKAEGEAEVASSGRKRRKGVAEDRGENAEKNSGERKRRKSTGGGEITEDEERKEGAEENKSTSRMCHQCQRNDKETITSCSKVHTHRFCGGCIRNWYPYHTPEEIQAICPKCLGVCNCKTCLRTFMPPPFKAESSPEQQRAMARWVLAWVMPHVRAMQKEQKQELEEEAARQGIDPSSLKVQRAQLLKGERIFCSHCQTGIAGLHRSCPECAYDLCLQCCREARSGALPGGAKAFKGMAEEALGTDGERKSEEIGGTGNGMVKSSGSIDAAAVAAAAAAAAAQNAQVAFGNIPLIAADQFPCCSLCQERATQVLQEMNGGSNSSGGSQVAATTPTGRIGEQEAAREKEKEVGRYYRKRANKAVSKEGEEAKEGQERKEKEKEKGKEAEGKGGNADGRKEGPPVRGLDFLMRPQQSSSTTASAATTTASAATTTAPAATTAAPAATTDGAAATTTTTTAEPAAAAATAASSSSVPESVVHFQQHWQRGEPIIVRHVMPPSVKDGLSWAPLVMWRAFRETKEGRSVQEKLTVVAIDCEDCTEVELGTHLFFECYTNGESKSAKVPDMLKVKDWPPTAAFQDRLPRHGAEFLRALPLHEYTHPEKGLLNLATAVPTGDPKADMGPKAYIAYGVREELVQGDSVTKLHFDMADAVNILTHCHYRPPSKRLQGLMRKHAEGNEAEAGHENGVATKSEKKKEASNGKGRGGGGGSEQQQQQSVGSAGGQVLTAGGGEGAALWDIFRREDSDKIRAFIARHQHEFRHLHNQVIQSMDDEIHDQTVYLTARHKEMLYTEYGVEAWTFEQRRGEAVFIPAGCAHQVRNLMSNMKIAVDFVSPEGTSHCLALTAHVRTMPVRHRSKEDRLEVKRMILHAVERSLAILKQSA
ncbi:unnamed protein product [Closterium sp. Yama58-4]|nr:unnamed protein product [Closterium sp. Yama58-4]